VTVWLSRDLVLAIHDEQIAAHGGAPGLRDAGLLESALAGPLNRVGCRDPDIAELAAVYAIGLVGNHPFTDGNKRTGYVALEAFLALNGARFPVTDAAAVIATLRLAAGDITDTDFTAWVRAHAEPAG